MFFCGYLVGAIIADLLFLMVTSDFLELSSRKYDGTKSWLSRRVAGRVRDADSENKKINFCCQVDLGMDRLSGKCDVEMYLPVPDYWLCLRLSET